MTNGNNAINTQLPFVVGSSGTYTSIQTAINAATVGATATNHNVVLINPGTYTENLTLNSFVDLASFGAINDGSVIVVGNAVYNPVNDNETFSAAGITFKTPGGGGSAFSINGVKICEIDLNECRFEGTTGTAFEVTNANSTIFKSSCHLKASAGQKILNMTDGNLTTLNAKVNATDTASTLSGAANVVLTGCFDANAFVLAGTSQLSVVNSTVLPPANLSFIDIGATATGILFGNTIVCNAASGFWATGTGFISSNAITTLTGAATLIDPALNFISQPLQIGSLNVIQQLQTLSMNTNFITNVIDPSNPQDAATKHYVDLVAQGLNILPAAYAATTGNLNAIYNNNGAGVGATLTNNGALAAFSIDGVSPPLNSNILVKNQTTTFQNGLYKLTTVGSGIVAWVLTRQTFYDEASEITPGDFVLVDFGTANSGSGWIQTATIVNVGVDAILFSRFGAQNSINKVVTQVISAIGASTYTPTAGMRYCIVENVGGGGQGGGSNSAAGTGSGGNGGGGAGYCRRTYTAAEIGATAAVVIGAAGAGAAAGAVGNNGGNSTFTPTGPGATLTASGGGGGAAGVANAAANATPITNNAGSASGGEVNIVGSMGSSGWVIANGVIGTGGAGGMSHFSTVSPSTAAATVSAGNPGNGFGAGGGGGISNGAGGARAGADGKPGICIITEFISATT